MTTVAQGPPHNYADALSKSILFFDGQRSGKLPSFQQMTWRKDSALHDGGDVQRDLMGGYYDGGDNVKFNFPMAFTTTMLSWSVLEFGNLMGPELQHALEALRCGTDYLLKSTNEPGSVVGVVGDPNADHACWERPEDMDTPRTSYVVTKEKPGSELSAEIAAALAASSIVFQQSDKAYSTLLLTRATQVFAFADQYRGSYNTSIGAGACPFYCDFSGYMDELIWGASWLYKATKAAGYWKYVKDNIHYLESNTVVRNINGDPVPFWVMTDPAESNPFVPKADQLICSILPESPAPKSVTFSPGGLLFKAGYCNLQHTTSLSFLLLVYSQYLKGANRTIYCGNNVVLGPANLVDFTRKQVDYILGNNPLGMSYMVGYGTKFPQRVHHRASVVPSMDNHPQLMKCHDGDQYFKSEAPNQNLLVGAVIGGPAENDTFEDSRYNPGQSEPVTYNNAPFVGVLAFFKDLYKL
ncbi:PREDICTED: endoglucanase 8-like [Fragaria vesca subsp. vesca]